MTAINTTTTVTTTTSTQTGTQLVVESQANTISVGEFVTDVSIQPYIANRIVSFYAYNMRPNQRLHIFFDSVLVDDYCAPSTRNVSNNYAVSTISDSSDYTSIPKDGDWGTAIYSDSNGIVAGQFNIPEATFRTGERLLQITDVDSLVLGSDAYSTIAAATFTASNLSVTKKSITLTTINPELSYVPVTNTVVSTNTSVTINTLPDIYNVTIWYEPLAQGLTINTPNGESGIYATSLELFFKQKSQTQQNGVTVYLCEVDNGYPNGNAILPFSTVHLPYSSINTSADGTTATKFTFDAPVFLNNKKEYSFVVKPDGGDPDYYVYMANLGDTDISSGYQVFSQPIIGTAFYGATEKQWTALQSEYVKFRLNRASFSNNYGNAVFNNSNTDFLTVYNIAYSNSSVGILPGDYVYESVNSLANSTGGTVNTSVYGTLRFYDSEKLIFYVEDSTGNFSSDSFVQVHRFANSSATTPNNSTLIAYANTGSLHNVQLNALVPQFATITPPGTTLNFEYSGTSNTYAQDSTYFKVHSGTETEFYDKERIVASKSNEVSSMSGSKSMTIRANMTTDTEYLSPVIDTVRHQELIIGNDVNPIELDYNEFFNDGDSKSKYVSKIITLAEGQDAEDLRITLTAYRPVGTDIQVWAKFLNREDSDPISAKTWTPMINLSYDLYSDPGNPTDMREFVFSTSEYYPMLTTSGTVTSSNTSNTVTGVGTAFDTELKPGWYVNMRASNTAGEQSRKIISIANSTQLTTEGAFIGNYTNELMFLVPPPSTAYLSANTTTVLTGTVSTNTLNNIITGSGTSFTTELNENSIIQVNGDQQKVVYISNNTSLTVGKPWSSYVTGANGYNVTPAGVTYLNDNLNLYSTFKRFQIKIILQSNDSSKVPVMDDLRCLALQL